MLSKYAMTITVTVISFFAAFALQTATALAEYELRQGPNGYTYNDRAAWQKWNQRIIKKSKRGRIAIAPVRKKASVKAAPKKRKAVTDKRKKNSTVSNRQTKSKTPQPPRKAKAQGRGKANDQRKNRRAESGNRQRGDGSGRRRRPQG